MPDILIIGDITEKFRKYYSYNNWNQVQNNSNIKINEEENQNEKLLIINPGDFSKDTLFGSINPSTLESNIYNLK